MKMNTKIALRLLLLVVPYAVFARKLAPEVEHAMGYGAETKICLKICDDMGLPISNASVRTYFDMLPVPHSVYGKTFDKDNCWVVRSRCQVDDEGSLVSAHYSVINNIAFGCDKGGVACICVTGAFNPTPNDTNLEDIETAKRARNFIRLCESP